ncbi:hypothetical protein BJ508DRAFT_200084, partial [Ascobolus immersus RN42]
PTGKCSFYTDCIEKKVKCGKDGYAKNYGKKYCDKFSNNKSKFSAKGKKWVDKTMVCLQKKLVPVVKGDKAYNTCKEIKSKAFGSHSNCYVSSGLCKLPPSDWMKIMKTVGAGGMFGGVRNMIEAVQTVDDCFPFVKWVL